MASLKDLLNTTPLDANNMPVPSRTMSGLLSNYQFQQSQISPINFGGNYALDESKYDQGMPFESIYNIQDYRAEAQPTIEKWANATGKMLGLAGTTFLQGTVGLVYGIDVALGQGKFSGFYNNEFTKSMDSINQYLEKELPNYYSQEELEMGLGRKLTTANFWADSIFKNLGFAIGAGLSGMGYAALGRSLFGINELATSSRALLAASQTGKSYKGLTGAALLKEIANDSKSLAAKGQFNTLFASLMGASGEASIEAYHNLEETKEQLTNLAINKKSESLGIAPEQVTLSEDELLEIEDLSAAAGNATFGLNAAILGTGNLIHFGKAFSKGWKAEKAALADIVKKDGVYAVDKATTGLGKAGAKVQKTASYLKNPLWEATEEQLQLVASKSSTDYALKSYDAEGATTAADYVSSIVEGFSEAYGTQEGWENAIAGFVIGAFGVPGMGGGLRQSYKDAKATNERTAKVVETLNNSLKANNTDKLFKNMIRQNALEAEKQTHLEANDVFNYKNAEADQMISDIEAFTNADMFETYLQQIQDKKQATPEELREMFKIINEDGTVTDPFIHLTDGQLQKHIDLTSSKMEEFANKVHQLKVDIDARFPYASDDMRGQLLHYGATIVNVDKRIEELSSQLPMELLNAIETYNEDKTETNKEALLNTIKSFDDINPLNNYKELSNDLSKLKIRRNDFVKAYQQALRNPKKKEKELVKLIEETNIQNVVNEAEDKAAANWWKENLNKDDHYELEVEGVEVPAKSTTYKYEYTDKNGQVKVHEVELYNTTVTEAPKATGVPADTIGDMSGSVDLNESFGITEMPKAGSGTTIKGQKLNPDGTFSNYTISPKANILSTTENDYGTSRKATRKVKVKIASKDDAKYFVALDQDGKEIPNEKYEIKKYYQSINPSNTITKAYRTNEARRTQRIKVLESLISSKQTRLGYILNTIDNAKLAKYEEEIFQLLAAFELVKQGATRMTNPLTGKGIGVRQAKQLVSQLELEYQTLIQAHNEAVDQTNSLEQEIAILKEELAKVENAEVVKTLEEEMVIYSNELDANKEYTSKLKSLIKAVEDFLKGLYQLLGIQERESAIRSTLLDKEYAENEDYYQQNISAIAQDMEYQEFESRWNELQESLSKEKGLLGRVQDKIGLLDKLRARLKTTQLQRESLLQYGKLLEEALALQNAQLAANQSAEAKKVKIDEKKYDTTQDRNKEDVVPTTNLTEEDEKTILRASARPEVIGAMAQTTHKINVGTKDDELVINPDLNQQRWDNYTEKIDLNEDNYYLALVTPNAAHTLFPNDEIYSAEDITKHTADNPNIKVVLFKGAPGSSEPVRVDGKLVFTTTRNPIGVADQVDYDNTNKPGFKYTNKNDYPKEDIIANLERLDNVRRTEWVPTIESKAKSKDDKYLMVQVVNNTNGIEIGRFVGITSNQPVIGTVVEEGTDPKEVTMVVATKGSLVVPTANNISIINTKPGVVYFLNKVGRTIKGYSRHFTNKEADNIIKLLMIMKDRYQSKSSDFSLMDTNGNKLEGDIITHLNNLIFYGRLATKDKSNNTYGDLYYYEGKLYFGRNGQNIPFTLDQLKAELNGGALKQFLLQQLHHVNKATLDANKPYNEIVDVVGDKVVVKPWNSYKEYLITAKQDGNPAPVGTRLPHISQKQFISTNLEFALPDSNIPETPMHVKEVKKESPKKFKGNKPKGKGKKVINNRKLNKLYYKAKKSKSNADWAKYFSFKNSLEVDAISQKNNIKWTSTTANTKEFVDPITGKVVVFVESGTMPKNQKSAEEVAKALGISFGTTEQVNPKIIFPSDTPNETSKNTTTKNDEVANAPNIEDISFRMAGITQTQQKENLSKAEAWLKSVLPNVNFKIVQSLGSSKVLGIFVDKGIQVIKDAQEGTVAHEAYHAVHRLYLSTKERMAIHKELKTWKNYSELLTKVSKEYKSKLDETNLSEEEKLLYLEEEILAEEFANYVITNGNYKKASLGTKIKNFFRQLFELLGFISKRDNVNQLFANINSGYYAPKAMVDQSYGQNLPYRLKGDSGVQFTVQETKALMDAMTYWTWSYLKNPEVDTNGNILRDNKLEYLIQNEALVDNLDIFYTSIAETLERLSKKYKDSPTVVYSKLSTPEARAELIYYHQKYLTNLGFSQANELDNDNTLEEEKLGITGRPDDYKASNEMDVKTTMSNIVKLLLSSVPVIDKIDGKDNYRINPLTNTPELLPFSKTYNTLSTQLAGLSTIEEMTAKMIELLPKHPELNSLMTILGLKQSEGVYLGSDGYNVANLPYQNMLLIQYFKQQMYKANLTHLLLLNKPSGEVHFTDANTDSYSRVVRGEWESNLLSLASSEANNGLFTLIKGKVKLDTELFNQYLKDLKSKVHSQKYTSDQKVKLTLGFLDKFGITFDNVPMFADNAAKVEFAKRAYDNLAATLEGAFKDVQNVDNIYSKDAALASTLNYFAEVASTTNYTGTELQYSGIDGQTIYNINLNSFLTHIVNSFRNPDKHKYITNDYTYGSTWASKLKEGAISIKLLIGSKIENESGGSETAKMTTPDNIALKVNSVLKGMYPLLRPGDKSLEYVFDAGLFFIDADPNTASVLTAFREHLTAEVVRYLKDKKGQITGSDIDKYVKNRGKYPLGVFHGIISSSVQAQLKDIPEVTDNNELELAKAFVEANIDEINNSITNYITKQADDNRQLLIDNRIIEVKNDNSYYNRAIDSDLVPIDRFKKSTADRVISEFQLEKLVNNFTINSLLANIEQTRVVTGNLLMYSDLLKRTSGIVGTKLIASNDPFINSWLEANEEYTSRKVNELGIPNGHIKAISYDDHIATVGSDVFTQYTNLMYDQLKNSIVDPSMGEVGSEEYENKVKAFIQDTISGTLELNEADGQGWITLPEYREFMLRIGKNWTLQHETVYEALMNGEKVAPEDLLYFNVLKPQYFGFREGDAQEGFYPPVFFKYSLMPLIPQVIRGTKLEKLNEYMLSEGIGFATMASGQKVGGTHKLDAQGKPIPAPLYNEDGSEINISNLPEYILPYDFFGIQVEASSKIKYRAPYGTQKRKLTAFDMFSLNEDGIQTIKPMYGSTEKATAMVEEFHNIQKEIIDSAFEKLLLDLNIVEDNGEYSGDNKSEVIRILKETLQQQGMLDNVYDSLNSLVDEKGDIVRYIDTLSVFDKLESVLTNIVNNKVIRQKVNGGMKVLVASTGLEKAGTTKNKTIQFSKDQVVKGQEAIAWGSNDLKFYEAKDGKTSLMEVKLPHYFKEFIAQGKDINFKDIDPNLLQLIGYRIPTDGLHSIEGMVVKEFLPIEAGDIIVLPSEIVAKAGSDYDIDKLTLIIPNYKVVRGKDNAIVGVKYIKYLDESYTTKDRARALLLTEPTKAKAIAKKYALKNFGAAKIDSFMTAIDDALETYYASRKQLIEDELSEEELDIELEEREYANENFEDLIAKLAGIIEEENYTILQQNTTKAIYNRSIKLDLEFIQAPENFVELMSPVSVRQLKKAANYIKYLRTVGNKAGGFNSEEFAAWEESNKSEELSPTKFIEFVTLQREGGNFQGGKQGVGIAALQLTHHQLAQLANLRINTINGANSLNFDLGVDYQFSTLANSKDAYGYSISATLSAMINAYVDIAKDPFIFKINAFIDFANTFMYLLRRGVPVEAVSLFMSQPIITEYYEATQVNKSNFLKAAESRTNKLTLSHKKLVAAVVTNFKQGQNIEPSSSKFTIENLRKGIINNGRDISLQLRVLDEFLQYKEQAEALNDLMSVNKYDTTTPSTMLEAKGLAPNRESILEMSKTFFINAEKMLDRTFLKSFARAAEAIYPMFRDMYITESSRFGLSEVVLDPIIDIIKANNFKDDQVNKVMGKVKRDLLTFLLQTTKTNSLLYEGVDSVSDLEYTLLNPNSSRSIAKQIQKIKKDKSNILHNNYFLSTLIPLISNKEGKGAENNQFRKKKLLPIEQEQLVESFQEIANTNLALAQDLMLAHILTGLQITPMNHLQYYSHSEFAKVIDPIINQLVINLNKNPENLPANIGKEFFNQFFRNNSKDTRIVPRVVPREYTAVQRGAGIVNGQMFTGLLIRANVAANKPFVQAPLLVGNEWVTEFYQAVGMVSTGDYVMYVPTTRLGDGMYSKQYKESLYKAVSATWEVNKETKVFNANYVYTNSNLANTTEDINTEQPITTTNENESSTINFQEEPSSGYRERTIKNASADATIALAVDFNSAGEKLTKSSVIGQKKQYIPIDANSLEITKERVDKIVELLNGVNAKSLNIAGNGIYTMKGKYTQEQVDEFTYQLLKAVIESPNLKNKITSIRTGGQTGFDEAGAKAGVKLGIPTSILAPKGWKFRNIKGEDISNEQLFKSRFSSTEGQYFQTKKTYTSNEAQAKQRMISKGLMNRSWGLPKWAYGDFVKEANKLALELQEKYGFPATERPFIMEGRGLYTQPNSRMFHIADALDGIWYPDNQYVREDFLYKELSKTYYQLDKPEPTVADKAVEDLNNKIKAFFLKIGVTYNPTTQILDRNGNPVEAIAVADILKKTVSVIEGKAAIDTLPEEAAHFFIEMLPQDHTLYQALRKKIEATEIYAETYNDYYTVYQGDVEKIAKEAMGKVIARAIVEQNSKDKSLDVKNNQSILTRIIQWLMNKFDKLTNTTVELDEAMVEFNKAVQTISGEILGIEDTTIPIIVNNTIDNTEPRPKSRLDVIDEMLEDAAKLNITKEELSNMSDEKLGELLEKLCKSSKFGR